MIKEHYKESNMSMASKYFIAGAASAGYVRNTLFFYSLIT